MPAARRYLGNPILSPDKTHDWEASATFNGCPIVDGDKTYLVYRAVSTEKEIDGVKMPLSTIGIAEGENRIEYKNRRQFIKPEQEWEKFGCEDPRITKLDNEFFIFYTAISKFPPEADGIKIAVALSDDLKTIKEKHLVTPFNAKAMALFPERIDGKIYAVLTVDTDRPPAKIAIAAFDKKEQIWDENWWRDWYNSIDKYVIPLLRSSSDHLEVGAVPVKVDEGWLLIYSYISNYFSENRTFGIEAVLLDSFDPYKKIGRTNRPVLIPEAGYELYGDIPSVVFPSGVLVHNNDLGIYYGAADTYCCLATLNLESLLSELRHLEYLQLPKKEAKVAFTRFSDNPIISPIPEHLWESKYTLNAAAISDGGFVHILYRAMGEDETSVLGYAKSADGVHIDERFSEPVYVPREEFELKKNNPGFSGCEDPRLTKIDDTIYMCYTGYDGVSPTKVALTSISEKNFLAGNWKWEKPIVISQNDKDDKNTCLFSQKIGGKYCFLHRLGKSIWIDYVSDFSEFRGEKALAGEILMKPSENSWDSEKIGIGPVPFLTDYGWLLIYHGLSKYDLKYRLGVCLLDLKNPAKVLARLDYPVLEPVENYENKGLRRGTVFSCGAVEVDDKIYVYYGGADQFLSVAWVDKKQILEELKKTKEVRFIPN